MACLIVLCISFSSYSFLTLLYSVVMVRLCQRVGGSGVQVSAFSPRYSALHFSRLFTPLYFGFKDSFVRCSCLRLIEFSVGVFFASPLKASLPCFFHLHQNRYPPADSQKIERSTAFLPKDSELLGLSIFSGERSEDWSGWEV